MHKNEADNALDSLKEKGYSGAYVKHTGYLFDAKTVIARHPQYTSPEVYLAECIDAFDHL